MNVNAKNLSELFEEAEMFFDNKDFLITLAQYEHTAAHKYLTLEKEKTSMVRVMRDLRQYIDSKVQQGRHLLQGNQLHTFNNARKLYAGINKNYQLVNQLMLKWVHICPTETKYTQ